MSAVAAPDKAVPVAADDHTVLQDHPVADGDPLANGDIRMDHTAITDPRTRSDSHVGKNDRVVADDRTLGNRHERADGNVAADLRIRCDRSPRMNAFGRAPGRSEQSNRPRKRQIRIGRPQHRAWRGRRVIAQENSRGVRARKRRFVLRVGQKRQIARQRLLDARHTNDLDVAVAFEATTKAIRQVLELHDRSTESITGRAAWRTRADAFAAVAPRT